MINCQIVILKHIPDMNGILESNANEKLTRFSLYMFYR